MISDTFLFAMGDDEGIMDDDELGDADVDEGDDKEEEEGEEEGDDLETVEE